MSNPTIKLNPYLHTVFIMVGCSGVGKSTFADKAAEALTNEVSSVILDKNSVAILSSDEIRRALIGNPDADKGSSEMLEASGQAFELLFSELRALMTFPIQKEFIFVDTKGYDPVFRARIIDECKRHQYNVELISFEPKEAEFLTYEEPSKDIQYAKDEMKYFKTKVLPTLKRREFSASTRITTLVEDVEVEIHSLAEYARCHVYIPEGKEYAVIGDIHESLNGFKELQTSILAQNPDTQIILVGDYLDKGNQTAEIISEIEAFVERGGLIVDANHESYVYRKLSDLLKTPAPKEIEDEFFTSIAILRTDLELQARFKNLYEKHTLPFVKAYGPSVRTSFVTHVPCETRYIGKLSSSSRKNQRNLIINRDKDMRESFTHIYKEAVGNHPLHIFGHVPHMSKKIMFKNKVFLDTGSCHGNMLTAYVAKAGKRAKTLTISVNCVQTFPKDLVENITLLPDSQIKPFSIYDYDLTIRELKFARRFKNNGVKYISGTMCPAPSVKTQGALEIESLDAAIRYYAQAGVTKLQAQPKYMGSRCQVYLFKKEPEKNFMVSRGGFKIKIKEEHKALLQKIYDEYNIEGVDWKESIILDGELLPWTALGKHFIEEQFNSYAELINYELQTLDNDQFFKDLDFKNTIDTKSKLAQLKIFKDNLALYAAEGELEFKAFNILKIDDFDVPPGTATFHEVNDDRHVDQVGITSETTEASPRLKKFFTDLTLQKRMEGIVLKPLGDHPNVAPYMKVRNEEYLTLVYGYDYKDRYEEHCFSKRIDGKLRLSIKEHEQAQELLTSTPETVLPMVVKMLGHLRKEQELDPRL